MAALKIHSTCSYAAPREATPLIKSCRTASRSSAPVQKPSLPLLSRKPLLLAGRTPLNRSRMVTVNSESVSAPAAKLEPEDGGLGRTLLLGVLFAGWYGANIFFNIFNKQVLKVYPYPVTCTCLQFAVGALMAVTASSLKLTSAPKFDKKTLLTILPLAIVHTLGNLFTNVSLGKVAVSFTHTIKAMEPFFSVLLSSIFLGDKPTLLIILSLFPIVGGVAAASVSEATFNWGGFAAAMGSNITFQSRNVLSKKCMGDSDVKMDNIALFSLITIMSFFILLPFALLTEGMTFTPEAMKAMGILNPNDVIWRAVMAGALFHTYQQVSYMILQRVTPVTHSIGNCLKRVIVIIASVIVFKNAMSTQNMIGTGVALFGVFCYSQAKRMGKKKAA